jgi:hypothetical protein
LENLYFFSKRRGVVLFFLFLLRKNKKQKKMQTDDDNIDPAFFEDVAASADVTTKRQNALSGRSGQLNFTRADFIDYVDRGTDGKKHIRSTTCPPSREIAGGKNGKFPAPLELNVRVNEVTEVPEQCIKNTEHGGWDILAKVKMAKKTKAQIITFLQNNLSAAYGEHFEDPAYDVIRKHINPQGAMPDTVMVHLNAGGFAKVTATDNKNSIFRKEAKPGVPLVQPSTPLAFYNMQAEVSLSIREQEIDDESVPPNEDGTRVKRKVTSLEEWVDFRCKGGVQVSEDYDPTMAESERLHVKENPNRHLLIPVAALRSKSKPAPTGSLYFYIKRQYQTSWTPDSTNPNLPGVTIMRVLGTTEADFVNTYQDQRTPQFNVAFNLFQWTGKPNTNEKYVCKAIVLTKKDNDTTWRSLGIPDVESYAKLMSTNLELPLHLYVGFWENQALSNEQNHPSKLNDRPEVANVQAYYTFIVQKIIPDYLRYFLTKGIEISQARAEREFAKWASLNMEDQSKEFHLKPLDEKTRSRNPLHGATGIMSTVISLGSGAGAIDSEKRCATHGIAGDVGPLFRGEHRFFVLTSHAMTTEETAKYAGPGRQVQFADDLIDAHKAAGAPYWIFAVRKDAKLHAPLPPVPVRNKPLPALPDEAPASSSSVKRELDEEEQEDVEEEEDSGFPTKKNKKE